MQEENKEYKGRHIAPSSEDMLEDEGFDLGDDKSGKIDKDKPSNVVEEKPSHLADDKPSNLASEKPSHLGDEKPNNLVEERPSHLGDEKPSHSGDENSNNKGGINTNPSRKKRSKGWTAVFWISLIVLVMCLGAIGYFVAGYAEGCKMYDDIADDNTAWDNNNLHLADMKVDWEALLAINPDTVGWVYCPGTKINYPVVHTNDNTTYLKKTFRGYESYVSFGTIFADQNNKHDLSDANIVTYGHNMNDGSMYATLADMTTDEGLNSHKNFYFLTPKGNYRLRPFAMDHVPGTEAIVQVSFANDASRVAYINDKINRAVAKSDERIPDPQAMSKIFTFSTCDNLSSDGRYVMFAYVAESTVDGVPGLE